MTSRVDNTAGEESSQRMRVCNWSVNSFGQISADVSSWFRPPLDSHVVSLFTNNGREFSHFPYILHAVLWFVERSYEHLHSLWRRRLGYISLVVEG